jgi:predicted nucleic acid-binding protein
MKYILDASVAVRWFLESNEFDKARQLRRDFENRVHELLAPETIIWETSNALIKAERQKLIVPGEAKAHFLNFLTTQPVLLSARRLVNRAMDIALQTQAGLYDCMYVVLADREKCELITADKRLVRNLQNRFPFVRSIATALF